MKTSTFILIALSGLGILAFIPKKSRNKKLKTKDGRFIEKINNFRVTRPKIDNFNQVILESDKNYLIKGTVPSSLSTQDLVNKFEINKSIKSLNFAQSLVGNERGFEIVFNSPGDWSWAIPGELPMLEFPNRVVSIQEIIE